MNKPQPFEQEGFDLTNPITDLPEQMPLPVELKDDATIVSGMWEAEPMDFIPPSDGAGREI